MDIFALLGFRLGLEPLGGRCVLASEIDRAARVTYLQNFGDKGELVGDITGVYGHGLPKIDVLTAG